MSNNNNFYANPLSPEDIETLKQHKELLDLGIITQIEFDNLKKSLLYANQQPQNTNIPRSNIANSKESKKREHLTTVKQKRKTNNTNIPKLYTWPIVITFLILFWPFGLFLLIKRLYINKSLDNTEKKPSTDNNINNIAPVAPLPNNNCTKFTKSNSHDFFSQLTPKKILILVIPIVVIIIGIVLANVFYFEPTGVPDLLAKQYVGECEYYEPDYYTTYTVEHNYDSNTHYDSVVITMMAESTYGSFLSSCNALFVYHTSDDTWGLVKRDEEWTKPVYSYNDNLVKTWYLDDVTINISKVVDNDIYFNYEISKMVYGGLFNGDVMLNISGSANATVNGSYMYTEVYLPDGFYCLGYNGGTEADLSIRLDIAEGLTGYTMSPVAYSG